MGTRISVWSITFFLGMVATGLAGAQGKLENPSPGANFSGIGTVSGWFCDADKIEIQFDDKPRKPAAYGTVRGDTEDECGDKDNGFSLLWAFYLLGEGEHRIRAFADGVQFADTTFQVGDINDGNFLDGAAGTYTLPDFPEKNTDTDVVWVESVQNFTITGSRPGSDGRDQIVGVTVKNYDGSLNPTKRHAECAQDFPGSHWCNTGEFLNGGKAGDPEEKLSTAWIRPSTAAVIPTTTESLYVDTSGIQTPLSQLNCNQWSSDSRNDGGLALQTTKKDKRQVVIVSQCSGELPILCCAR